MTTSRDAKGGAGSGENNRADAIAAATVDSTAATSVPAAFTRPSSAVVVRSAYKQYGQTAILKDLNLTIPDGKM